MSAPFFVPFNFQPISIQRGSGTYTVPAGKYARVSVNLSVFCTPGFVSPTVMVNPGVKSENVDIFLKSGDSLTFTQTLSAASVNPSTAGNLVNTLSANINGSPFLLCRMVTYYQQSTGIADINRGSDSLWLAQEFNEIT